MERVTKYSSLNQTSQCTCVKVIQFDLTSNQMVCKLTWNNLYCIYIILNTYTTRFYNFPNIIYIKPTDLTDTRYVRLSILRQLIEQILAMFGYLY